MNLLPPIPAWEGLHPLVTHFPIALLLVAPLLIAISLFVRTARPWAIAGLLIMSLGTAAAYVSVSTGEAAGERAEHSVASAKAVLEEHEEMAETTRNVFTALSLMFATLVLAPLVLRRPLSRTVSVTATVIFLALYGGGALILVGTAHQGGRLVHEFGVRASLAPASSAQRTADGGGSAREESDEAQEFGGRN